VIKTAEINYHYRSDEGRVEESGRIVPYSIDCYNRGHERSVEFIDKEVGKGLDYVLMMANIFLDELSGKGSPLKLGPLERCGVYEAYMQQNKTQRLKCAAHAYISLVLISVEKEFKKRLSEKVGEQGLDGLIDVELIEQYDPEKRTWNVDGKYNGHSVDLYGLTLKKDGSYKEFFFEGENESVEKKISDFFNDASFSCVSFS
jgi:hypothetical protein